MQSFFISLGVWNWFIAAGVLLVLEVMAPGTFFLWLGLSALAVGGISLLFSITWQIQAILFAILALVSLALWRKVSPRVEQPADQPFLNRRAEALVGRTFVLEKPIVAGSGTVRIDDTVWRVRGPDSPAGSHVRVTGVDGALLLVDAMAA